jgi:hypothetical protein
MMFQFIRESLNMLYAGNFVIAAAEKGQSGLLGADPSQNFRQNSGRQTPTSCSL